MKYKYVPNVAVRLVKEPPVFNCKIRVTDTTAAITAVKEYLRSMDRECFCELCLDIKANPICFNIVSIGTLDASLVSPREVFKPAILANAASIILFHCHPSGELKESLNDVATTDRLIKAGNTLGIQVLDHIIVGCNSEDFMSMRSMHTYRETEIYAESLKELNFKED